MAEGYFLTDADRAAFQDALEFLRRIGFTTRAQPEHDQSHAPEVYVARTPSAADEPPDGGIPALTPAAPPDTDDEPGYADCDLYRIVVDGSDHRLKPYPEHSRRVYNLSTAPIGPEEWVIVTRHKAGHWLATGGSVGAAGFWGYLITADCATGLFVAYEVEPIEGGSWQLRENGVYSENVYYENKHHFPDGGPLLAEGTIRWLRPGYAGPPQEYLFGGPVGWTGTKEYPKRIVCVGGQLRVLPYYERKWNGLTVKPPCHDADVLPCDECPSDPPP